MILLGVDTSSLAASCAIWRDGELVGESFANAGLTHSQTILPMIHSLLQHARMELAAVDGLAVSAGPGSFTGLRIGISAVKGMALALGKPCAAVSTLEGLAANLSGYPGVIVPVMDARCSQVYTALFRSEGGTLKRLAEDSAISIQELRERLQKQNAPVVLVGDGAVLCGRELQDLEHLSLAPAALLHQRASSVCLLAEQRQEWMSPHDLAPSYLRLAQAQRELLKKQGKL